MKKRKAPLVLRIAGYLFSIGTVAFVIVAAGVGYYLWNLTKDMPDYAALKNYEPPVMTRTYAADGQLLAEYATERRLYIPIQAVPQLVINAFLSAEDKNFYSHPGVDVMGLARAVKVFVETKFLGSNQRLVGGSTITQQVAKNFLLTSERSIDRKAKEAILSLRIESTYSKDRILELYLNEINFGFRSYGIAAAALNYFDKSVHELELHEAAYMAALPKAPENYNPYRNREEALIRRNWVIDRMIENGHATPEEGLAAKERDLDVNPRPLGTRIAAAEYFAEEVRREIGDRYGESALNEGGLTIRTSLDPKLQQVARKALVDGLVGYDRRRGYRGPVAQIALGEDWGLDVAKIDDLDDVEPWRMAVVLSVSGEGAQIGLRPATLRGNRVDSARDLGTITPNGVQWTGKSLGNVLTVGDVVYVSPREEEGNYTLQQIPEVQGALTAMDTKTGRVLAMVGGFSFDQSVFNRATQAQRQPGSSFKPLIYAAALDNGYTPSSIILDAPVSFPDGRGGAWEPKNYGGGSAGPSTLRRGIEKSRNLMTVRLANDLGMPLVAEYSRRFGVYDDLAPVLAMSLGAGETTVLKMTAAYATIANGGQKITPTLIDRVQDRYGKTVYKHDNRECRECSLPDWHPQDEPTLIDNREFVL
ncbi:MAG: transglycosylase domain-containing protein, partial [Pseudomonadota bacterium]